MLPSSTSPPTPAYIFRGHQAAIHALHFFQQNQFFASGDSDGWIVIWRLASRRPVAVWHAHEGGVMGLKDWEGTRLIRDHKLCVWQLGQNDFDKLSIRLPVDGATKDTQRPWLLHTMSMNALNFCAFTICPDSDPTSLLLASPNGLDSGGIDVFQLPSEQRVSKIQSDKSINAGMVMTLRIFASNSGMLIVAGFEDGQVMVYKRKPTETAPVWTWDQILLSRPHKQPILSLDVTPDHLSFITSSADAMLAKFDLSNSSEKLVNTKHAGQQDLTVRSDGKIFATAGWDKNVRVYSVKTLKELAVLKWHQMGCYAIAFTEILPELEDNVSNAQDSAIVKMKQNWEDKQHHIHWLIAGSKDGKISMWEIY